MTEDAARTNPAVSNVNARRPEGASSPRPSGQFDLNIHASGKIELHERIDRLRRRLHDIKHTLVGANLELLPALLVNVGTTIDRELLDPGGKRNGTTNERAGAAGSVGDVAGRLI